MHKIKLPLACALFLLLAMPHATLARAQDGKHGSPGIIPQALRMLLERANRGSEDNFAAAALKRLSFPPERVLTANGVKDLYAAEERKKLHRHVEELLRTYDLDQNHSISSAEVIQALAAWREKLAGEEGVEEYSRAVFRHLMSYDKDKDKAISAAEMLEIPFETDLSRFVSAGTESAAYFEELLKLDPNGDGKLTAQELESLARGAFRAADADGDGHLSSAETNFLQAQKEYELPFDSPCRMPAPEPDARIVFIATQSAYGLSRHTVAGPHADTGVAQIEIMPDAGKIHVVVSADKPLIWVFKGDTSLVSGLSVFGDVAPRQDKVQAGVTGIPARKISFASSIHCLKGNFGAFGIDNSGLPNPLVKILGHEEEIAGHNARLRRARIARSSISFEAAPDCTVMKIFDPPIPEGFDPDTWFNAATVGHDRRLYDLSGMEIVSPLPVEKYLVLPGWAGIAKLVHDGVIVREGTHEWQASLCNRANTLGPMMARPIQAGGIYKIVKDIPYFPAMETPSPHYVLARGIKLPGGYPNSCVTEEGTGKVLRNREDCKSRKTHGR